MPTIWPSNMTAIRSPTARTSSSSVLTMRIAAPGVPLLDNATMDVLDRPDVEAAGRLSGYDEIHRDRELARYHHLLLVAARERAGERIDRRRADIEVPGPLARPAGGPPRRSGCHPCCTADGDSCPGCSSRRPSSRDQPVAASVLGDVGDARGRTPRVGGLVGGWPAIVISRSRLGAGPRSPRRARSARCPGRPR